ncbi:MAG: hypothetical protein OXJ37_11955 [Bryobacterales bacterium]|nr:hypothetical protein [Bryobacterales bacterium]MDE0624281.1 hypothetical protein [Bryobacterales bacterium]
MCVLVLLGVALTAVPGIAQSLGTAVEDGGPALTAESGLVVVPLHVYKSRKSVRGLGMQAFELVEDGMVQDIAFVEGPGGLDDPAIAQAVPIEIMLLVDSEETTKIDFLDKRKIRHSFFEGVRDNVAISVYGFAGGLKRLAGPTRDIAKIQIGFEMAYSSGYGHIPILDAIIAAARDAATRIRNASRKLVVYSRGLDPWIFGAAAHAALDFEIPVYDLVVNPQEPSAIERTTLYSFRSYPLLLGRPGPRFQAAPQEFPVGRYQNLRSVPFHKCCPLGMEMIRVHKRMGLDAPYRANSRSADPKHRKSMLVRAYLESLARLAQDEYFVGYHPIPKGDEPVARQVEVRLKNKRIGQLFGGKRVIIY